jgi:hypothetical protein
MGLDWVWLGEIALSWTIETLSEFSRRAARVVGSIMIVDDGWGVILKLLLLCMWIVRRSIIDEERGEAAGHCGGWWEAKERVTTGHSLGYWVSVSEEELFIRPRHRTSVNV